MPDRGAEASDSDFEAAAEAASSELASGASEQSSPGNPSLAQQEAGKLSAGIDLAADGKNREHYRYQSFRDHANAAALLVFWAVVLALLWGVAVYAAHLLMPTVVNFLNEKQLSRLESLLGTALLSSALTGYVNKRMSD